MNTYIVNIKAERGCGDTVRFRTKVEANTSDTAAVLAGIEFHSEFGDCEVKEATADRVGGEF